MLGPRARRSPVPSAGRLVSGITMHWNHHWAVLAILAGAFAFVLPFIRYGLTARVLAPRISR